MSLESLASFISVIGFPSFMAYYIFTKYAEEKKRNDSYKEILHNIEKVVAKWDIIISSQTSLLERLVQKIDKVLECATIIIERIDKKEGSR